MDIPIDQNVPFKILVEFVGGGGHHPQHSRDDWRLLEEKYGEQVYARLIHTLTHLEFDASTAKDYWHRLLDHRDQLSQALGRDVGMPVALCDFFTNLEPKFQNMGFVEVTFLLHNERNMLVDELTGLHNRRFCHHMLKKQVEHTKRTGEPFSLILMDIDRFSDFNRRNGMNTGNQALIDLGRVLMKNTRAVDHIIRYGGDEFAIILPDSGKDEALLTAERHREAIAAHNFAGAERLPSGQLTVSIGVATHPVDGHDALELFQRVDEALFRGQDRPNHVFGCHPNQRSCPRYPLYVEMLYRLQGVITAVDTIAKTRDISLGGLMCSTQEPLSVGVSLLVQLTHPDHPLEMVEFEAKTVRLSTDPDSPESYHIGVSFELNSEEQKKTLHRLVAKQMDGLH